MCGDVISHIVDISCKKKQNNKQQWVSPSLSVSSCLIAALSSESEDVNL